MVCYTEINMYALPSLFQPTHCKNLYEDEFYTHNTKSLRTMCILNKIYPYVLATCIIFVLIFLMIVTSDSVL